MFTDETCTICSGAYDVGVAKEKQRKDDIIDARAEVKEAKDRYTLSRIRLSKTDDACERELWEEADYRDLHDKLQGYPDGKGKGFTAKALDLATVLGRSYMSIKWHHKYMFMEPEPVKRREWWYREMRAGNLSYEDWLNYKYPVEVAV